MVLLVAALLGLATPAFAVPLPVEGYPSYEPQTVCRDRAQPGTRAMAGWINRRFAGGAARATVRPCASGGRSEHKDGRAIDWRMSAGKKRHRVIVRTFLRRLRATDRDGNEDALARRMGVMYVIWNDRMYAAWNQYDAEPYLSSSCRTRRRCSRTLRHRDHVHISLSEAGGRAETSWYLPPS